MSANAQSEWPRVIQAAALRTCIGATLDRIEQDRRPSAIAITRRGELIAVIVSPNLARWGIALETLWVDRLPPFTPERLNEFAQGLLSRVDIEALIEAMPD